MGSLCEIISLLFAKLVISIIYPFLPKPCSPVVPYDINCTDAFYNHFFKNQIQSLLCFSNSHLATILCGGNSGHNIFLHFTLLSLSLNKIDDSSCNHLYHQDDLSPHFVMTLCVGVSVVLVCWLCCVLLCWCVVIFCW